MFIAIRVLLALTALGLTLAFGASLSGRAAAWDESVFAIVPLTLLFLFFWLFAHRFKPDRLRDDPARLAAWQRKNGVVLGASAAVFLVVVGVGSALFTMDRRERAISQSDFKRSEDLRRRNEHEARIRYQRARARSFPLEAEYAPPPAAPPPYRSYDDGSLESAYARDDADGIIISWSFAAVALLPLAGLLIALKKRG